MNMTNSVIIEGVMTAGLTSNGYFTIENVRLEGGGKEENTFLCKLTPALLESEDARKAFKNGTTFRLVGYLSKDTDVKPMVMTEAFERVGVRSGKYNFAIEN
jgi:hypothetical protein